METELAHSKKRPMHTFSFYLCENTDKDIERYKSWYRTLYNDDINLIMLSRYNLKIYNTRVQYYLDNIAGKLTEKAIKILNRLEDK